MIRLSQWWYFWQLTPPEPSDVTAKTVDRYSRNDTTRARFSGIPMPVVCDEVCQHGERLTINYTERPAPSLVNPHPTPTDITGWTFEGTIRRRFSGSILQTGAGTITSEAQGQYSVPFDASVLDPGVYTYEVWRTNAGAEACLAKGAFTINQSHR